MVIGSIAGSEVRLRTLAGLLKARAAEWPDREAYLFLAPGKAAESVESAESEEVPAERLTWGELDGRARAIAAALAEAVPPGERALLLFPPGLDFVAAFFGCLYSGAVAVPVYPPRRDDRCEALRAIARDAAPRLVLTTAALASGGPGALAGRLPELAAARLLASDALPLGSAAELPEPDPGAVALLQYTSGSTSSPKGVVVTHANLIHNERMIRAAFGVDRESTVVGWLPLYHDMGLIGNLLQPLHAGARCVLMAPLAFLQRPRRWLEAIHRFRATVSGGPNFAYELCARKIPPAARQGLDLSSWRVAFNGAEPVRAHTLERFAEAFAPAGFRREAFYPCYGLAEATLFAAGGDRRRAPRVEEVDAAALARGEAIAATPQAAVRRVVGCGHAFLGQRLAIADPQTGAELPPGRVGEIWIAGQSVARGYWRDPAATQRVFAARLASGEGPFLRTGDLGFVRRGATDELFVTGRLKDLIILRGRNHYPQDLELAAERGHPALRPGCGAAFAVEPGPGESDERLVLVLEVEHRRAREMKGRDGLSEVADAVRGAVAEEHEVQPFEVVLVQAGTVPKTSSGKIRRLACRARYLEGELAVLARSLRAAEPDGPEAAGSEPVDAPVPSRLALNALAALAPGERTAWLAAWLRERAAAALGVAPAAIDQWRPLTAQGLDSLSAVELAGAVEAALGVELPLSALLEGAGLRTVAGRLASALEGAAHRRVEAPPVQASDAAADAPLSPGQQALWFLERLAPENGVGNVALAARARGLDARALRHALAQVVARHPALRTIFPLVAGEPVQRILPVPPSMQRLCDVAVEDYSKHLLDRPPQPLDPLPSPPGGKGTPPPSHGRKGFDLPQDGDPAVSEAGLDFQEIDIRAWSPRRLRERLSAEAWKPFALERGPLLRVRVFSRPGGPGERCLLLLAVHHSVADFWSLGVIARELGVFYAPASGRQPRELAANLPPPSRDYADFVRWQAEWLAGPAGERLWAFWRQELAGERGPLPDLALPTDRLRPPVQTWRGLSRAAELPAELVAALRSLAATEATTLFTVLAAAWQCQLGRYAGQDDFAIGVPTSGRGAPEWARVVGYFVNPVALRADLGGDPPFRGLLARTRRTALAALEHAGYPFARLVERLRSVRDPGRPPLFQVLLTFEQGRAEDDRGLAAFALGEDGARLHLGRAVELISVALAERRAQHELALSAAELAGGGLALSLEVSSDLFDAASAARMLGHFRALLAAAAAAPDRRASELPLLTAEEGGELRRGRRAPRTLLLHELVAERARRSPQALALIAGNERLTYAELMGRAAALARRLRRQAGIGPERVAALLVERSADLVVGALGILAAGGVYLPVDPDQSAARLALILEDSGAAALVTQRSLAQRLPQTGIPVVLADTGDLADLADVAAAPVLPANLAYVVYTSGSTGRPKGVAVSHAAAAEHCSTWCRVNRIGESDRVLQLPSAAFDAAVEQIFSTLIAGATLVLRGPAPWGPRELAARAAELGLTVADLPTAFFVRWVEDAAELGDPPPSLRLVGAFGEELHAETARRFGRTPLAGVRLVNSYGPTEAVISATLAEVRPEEAERGPVPIGRPLPGRVARVLDRRGQPQPVGVPGELYLGGVLARGYLGRPDWTAERFVPDPWGAPGDRLYRSGDLVRRRAGGALEFLGRLDDQVKIRGFRVEPGEIEAALAAHPGVREAAVLALPEPAAPRQRGAESPWPATLGQRRLLACVAPALPAGLGAFLRQRLPDYMIPELWLALPALPLDAGGKVNRGELARRSAEAAALPASPADAGPALPGGGPRGPVEELVAGIFASLLGRDGVGAGDDFFALGGHSLLATRAVARISALLGVDLPVSALFSAPTPASLAELIAGASPAAAAPPIAPLPRLAGQPLPLSYAQRRLWFLEQLAPGTAVYNLAGGARLAGRLEVPALAAALAEVVRRHEVLRAVFPLLGGQPVQRIGPAAGLAPQILPLVDLSGLTGDVREAETERCARQEARLPFDLARGPLLRMVLLRRQATEHRLLATFHHIVVDGWSLGVFFDELASLYAARAARAAPSDRRRRQAPPPRPARSGGLPEPPVQYSDFAAWQAQWLAGEVLERQLAYWRERLAGLPVLELPADRPRPALRDPRGATRVLRLGGEAVGSVAPLGGFAQFAGLARFARLARSQGVTLFMALLGMFLALLARLTGEEVVAVGSPVANRRRPEVERLIGLFVNTLVLDARVGDDPELGELLARVRRTCLGAYAHQDLPFERLVEELQPSRDLAQNPLFQVMFALEEPLPGRAIDAYGNVGPVAPRRGARPGSGLVIEPLRGDTGTAKFDLLLTASPCSDGGWELLAEYAAALWEPVSIDRLLGHFQVLLEGAAAAGPVARLAQLPLLSVAERQQIVEEWNDTAAHPQPATCLHHLVAARAALAPDAVAVVGEGERLTYGELVARAGRLAGLLRGLRGVRSQGIGPESRVGLCLRRTPALIEAMLGILQAGAAYVPLDPAYPPERLELMLADAGAEALLTEPALAGRLARFAGPTLLLGAPMPPEASGAGTAGRRTAAAAERNLAYVIFTSGSTGRPKGVGIEHRSAVALVRWALELYARRELAGVLAATSVCFDLSIFEIFVPLAAGGRVILAPTITRLPELAARGEVTLVNAVPSPVAELLAAGTELPAALRTVNLAGEALTAELAARLYAHGQIERVLNLYGPTEDTTYSTVAPVPRGAARVPIGRPLAGTRARVLGPQGEPLPVGIPGEVALAGEGLARGYLGRPELTAERFVPDPCGPAGARMYRTGDLARLLPDGQLDFLGRRDHQVKLHGLRIELGEIESLLARHPAVAQAVVALCRDGPPGPQLVGYVVPRTPAGPPRGGTDPALRPEPGMEAAERSALAAALASWLRLRLPAFMVPPAWVVLPALPLTPSGKVDRRALPAPSAAGLPAGREGQVAPRNPVEEKLAAIWRELLGREQIGVHDSFFDLGGHSLLAVRAAFRAGEAFGIEVPVAALFEAPTVARLAERLARGGALMPAVGAPGGAGSAGAGAAGAAAAAPVPRAGDAGAASAFPLSFAQRRLWFLERLRPGQAGYNLGVWVRLSGELSAAALAASLAEIVCRHEPLRTVYSEVDGQPLQTVLPAAAGGTAAGTGRPAGSLAQADLRRLPPARRDGALRRVSHCLLARPFDLERGPLARFLLVRLATGEHALLCAFHHLATDGWSLEIFFAELAALYAAARAGRPSPLPELPWRYADHVRWQAQALAGERLAEQLAWWRRRLAGAPVLELPLDRPRPPVWEARGAASRFALAPDLAGELAALARAEGGTLFMALLAAFITLLARYSGQDDISVGVPVAGRLRAETERMIGLFVNTLVVRVALDGAAGFRALLRQVRDTVLAAQAHQEVPFERLVEELQPERTTGASPIFQVTFSYLSSGATVEMPGLRLAQLDGEIATARFDLSCALHERGGRIHGWLEHAAALFAAATAGRMRDHFLNLLGAAAAAPDRRALELPLLGAAERHQLLWEWNRRSLDGLSAGGDAGAAPATVPALLQRWAAAAPESPALLGRGESLTYGQLTELSARLARQLAGLGLAPEDRVGLLLDRTVGVVVAMLGVWQAGAAWVPLDPGLPAARLADMAADAGLAMVLADPGRRPAWEIPVVELDLAALRHEQGVDGVPAWPEPGWLAYMIFTSGTTGRPKAVAIEHGSLLRTLAGWQELFPFAADDRMPHLAPLSFDTTLIELFSPLLEGGRVEMLASAEILDFPRLLATLRRSTQAIQVPSLWRRFIAFLREGGEAGETSGLAALRRVYVGGERVPADLLRDLQEVFPAAEIVETYGPTETAITAAALRVGRGAVDERSLLGRPLPGSTLFVLDRWGSPAPIGVAGELYIGGAGVARGYHGRPELTADRFRPSPFAPGGRLYRTGDLTRRLADGRVEFLGRTDYQIKLRGLRIEPGEIEAALRSLPEVRDAVVTAASAPAASAISATPGNAGEARLVAYVVPAAAAALAGEERQRLVAGLRLALAARLPDYMVPAAWVTLAALPLSANGKVDRRALPEPEETGEIEAAALRTPEEELLAGLWGEVLGVARVGAGDNFFALGGHSLLVTQLSSRLRRAFGVEVPVADLFGARTLAEQARLVAAALRRPAASAEPPPPLVSRPRQGAAPLSFAQERLWFLHRLEPGPLYNMPMAARLRGPLVVGALAAALDEIVRRHEALRTRFVEAQGRPAQVPLPWPAAGRHGRAPLPALVDLGGLPAERREDAAAALAAAAARRPFDLASGRLVRAALLRLAAAEHWLVLTVHHIAADGWSTGVLLDELAELYSAALAGRAPRLAALPVQYADFALWQRQWLAGEVLGRELEHWRRRLAGAPEELELPADRPRRPDGAARGAQRPFSLAGDTGGELARLARRRGWTPFMPLLAAYAALLARWSGRRDATDLVVGSPIANRNRLEIERLIGFFANTLALRLDLAGDPPFGELADRARAVCLEAYVHQDLPFEKLVEEIAPVRRAGRTPLLQTLLVLQNAPLRLEIPGLGVELLEIGTGTAKFDLVLVFAEAAGGLAGGVEYSRDLFDESTIDRLVGHYRNLLAAAVADPAARLSQLPLLGAAERAQLARLAAGGSTPHPRLVHRRVAERAEMAPDACAVVCGGERLSYGGLVARARALGRRLRRLGVGPDVPVGLLLAHSCDAMVALLGVLEAGGAYLALDPGHPEERRRQMLVDAGAPVVLADKRLAAAAQAGEVAVLAIEEARRPDAAAAPLAPPAPEALPDHLVYVTYTSGSTGRPKGVAMTHAAASAMLDWQLRTSAAGGGRTLQFTSLAFDVSFQEIFATWCAGGTLVLVSEEVRRDPPALCRLLAEERVERLFLPLVALQQVADAAAALWPPLPTSATETLLPPLRLREVMSAGEQLQVTPQIAALFARLPGAALHNHYGPAETHAVTWLALEAGGGGESAGPARWPARPPIGRPVDHARVLLLDRHLRRVPLGVPGEVWVGGTGLARGYLGRPELTAERFLPDPFAEVTGWRPGSRLYRTGDLARLRPDGAAEFLGRADLQVKVRGQRIEPAEVESALAHHPAVLQAAVGAYGDSAASRRLVAWVVFRSPAPPPTAGELRRFLAATLPEPMVPSAWVRLDRLPLTSTGKVDRRALSRLELHGSLWGEESGEPGAAAFVPPRNPAEDLLAGIWREVLGVGRVGAHDDFFALGGHSLLATQVASRVREAFGVELPLRRLFETPVLAAQAAEIVELARAGAAPAPPPLRRAARAGDLPLSFAQERLWFLARLQPESAAYNVPLVLRVSGRLDGCRLAAALSALRRRHEALRTLFVERDGVPAQVVLPPAAAGMRVPLADLRGLPAERREAVARRLIAAEAARPFDLARGPLIRVLRLAVEGSSLAPGAAGGELLLVSLHHIVADGWSLGVLVRDLTALHAGRPLPELPVQYADFALWQRRWLSGETLARQLAWWRKRLAGAPAALELPADRPRPPVQSGRGAEHRFRLDAELSRRLAALAGREGSTLFMALAAGLAALLGRLSGQRDLVLGAPIANRNRVETEDLIGFFVNTLVLRVELAGAASFGALLRQVREVSLAAFAHQDVPFEKLVDELQPRRELSRSPLFEVAVALQNAPLPAHVELAGARLVPEEIPGAVAKFDLAWFFAAGEDGRIEGVLQYAQDLFDAATAARWAGHLGVLLGHLAGAHEAAGGALAAAPLLGAAESHQVLREWNDTRTASPAGRPVHRLVEEQAARRPQAPAVVEEGRSLSYGELETRANRLAALLAELGAGSGAPVATWIERSADLVVAQLAALKAGACYLPLDPAWPAARVAEVLAAAGAPVLLTRQARLAAALEAVPGAVVCLDLGSPAAGGGRLWSGGDVERFPAARPRRVSAGDDLAYVIYTSGSTGRPKGVEILHAGLAGRVEWYRHILGLSAADRTTLVASPAFDLSVLEIWSCLTVGASLYVIADPEVRLVPSRLFAWLAAEGITACFLPTPLAELALAEAERGVPPGLRLRALVTGGDRLRRLPRRPLPFALVNLYGPAECTVMATAEVWAAGETAAAAGTGEVWAAATRPPPIGRPVDGARVYIVDADLAPVPVGVPGEILIGGAGLGRGYLGRPDLTAERFLPDPFAGTEGAAGRGGRAYRTGDLARFGPDGRVEFLGRIDHQIKVRGHRTEPAEVEAALLRHPRVKEAVVVARSARDDAAGDKLLVAYVVAAPASSASPDLSAPLDTEELRAFLLTRLPDYMVPTVLVEIAAMPLGGNGKLDRAALPPPEAGRAARAYVAPRNELERAIGAAWREILGLDRIGVQESFFEMGGNSLLLARLQSRLRQALGRDIPILELFRHPTIEGLARSLGGQAAPPAAQAERVRGRAEARQDSMRRLRQRGPRVARGERDE
ncbi:MAG TPA: non-ribosomal peptide synthase/polyketide synthase [Thermoanaerobaculia bacterium]|nr:non-ribosomal peptide synthase/polyketide synthase [Thermoanaerobaculia bacterium]